MIATIRAAIKDPEFEILLNTEWSSQSKNYRQEIRKTLAKDFTQHFTREQLVHLNDLTWIPKSEIGWFSISHCQRIGGFSYSKHLHGFDIEEVVRISEPILRRTCTSEEYEAAPKKYYLWAAKEAAFKALDRSEDANSSELIITDLHCFGWKSQFGKDVWGFQIKSEKNLSFYLNRGFVFEEKDLVFAVYFR